MQILYTNPATGGSMIIPYAGLAVAVAHESSAEELLKRRIKPVGTIGEMVDRIDYYNRVRWTLKSKNKACRRIGYSKGTINAYRDRVEESQAIGIDLDMYRYTKYRDFKRLLSDPQSCQMSLQADGPSSTNLNSPLLLLLLQAYLPPLLIHLLSILTSITIILLLIRIPVQRHPPSLLSLIQCCQD
jgi:hypothetical protein